ncbi:NTP transferase domain-containing protein [Candidatus Microgenomates bacterium]|nr:NTP transferase domain-containing protein [Candidatus Microgenomates bacterium]
MVRSRSSERNTEKIKIKMNYQVVILAGGESSRFTPFNNLHKSFFKLGGKSIIQRTLSDILDNLEMEVILVLGSKNFEKEKSIIESYGYGKKITCVKQNESLGQGNAILSAKDNVNGDFFVINAQQFNFSKISDNFVKTFESKKFEALVGSQKTSEPWKYGILYKNENNVIGVVEKPKKGTEPSATRIVGVYLFSKVFLGELENTKQSEYSLEKALDLTSKKSRLGDVTISDAVPSLKYPWDLLKIKDIFLKDLRGIDKSAEVAKTATIKGEVYIGKNTKVCDYALIEGPVYIGENVVVGSYSQVRGGSVLEEGSVLQRYVDVKNSIIGEQTSIHSGFIGDSVVGKNVKIGAGFISANKRFDRRNISVEVKNKKVDSGINGLGVLVGDESNIGIRVSTMPGTLIKYNSKIFPGEIVK